MFAELLHNERQDPSEPGPPAPVATCPEPLLGAWVRTKPVGDDGGAVSLEFDNRGMLISTMQADNVVKASFLQYAVAGDKIFTNRLLASRMRESLKYSIREDGSLVLNAANGASTFVRQ